MLGEPLKGLVLYPGQAFWGSHNWVPLVLRGGGLLQNPTSLGHFRLLLEGQPSCLVVEPLPGKLEPARPPVPFSAHPPLPVCRTLHRSSEDTAREQRTAGLGLLPPLAVQQASLGPAVPPHQQSVSVFAKDRLRPRDQADVRPSPEQPVPYHLTPSAACSRRS